MVLFCKKNPPFSPNWNPPQSHQPYHQHITNHPNWNPSQLPQANPHTHNNPPPPQLSTTHGEDFKLEEPKNSDREIHDQSDPQTEKDPQGERSIDRNTSKIHGGVDLF